MYVSAKLRAGLSEFQSWREECVPIGPWTQNSLSSSIIILGPESDYALLSALVSLRIQLMRFVPGK